jgi:uncharacterized protein (TIGR02145 family)
MKKIFYLLIIITITLNACKKEQVPERTVGINGINYKTVLLGSKTWLAVNYRGPGGIDLANNADDGKLYTIAEAKLVTLPKGWRIPTIDDFYDLMVLTGAGDPRDGYSNITKSQVLSLMSATGWSVQNGTNTTGFNAMPSGYYVQTANGLVWQEYKNLAMFLTTTSYVQNVSQVFTIGVNAAGATIANNTNALKTVNDRASLRFVRDN